MNFSIRIEMTCATIMREDTLWLDQLKSCKIFLGESLKRENLRMDILKGKWKIGVQ